MAAGEHAPLYSKLPKDARRIRRLTILPNVDESAIVECTLAECDLDHAETRYDALSYCWGDPNVTTPVIVNGRKMQVTINLRDALHKLRSYSAPNAMILWADALCINQKDEEERGHQVQFMGDIYSKASTVHAWLGHGDHLEKRGLAAFERLSRSDCSEPNNMPIAHAVTYSASDKDFFELAFVSCVCDAPYWQRVWIIQELSLARKVVLHQGPHQAMITCWACQVNRINSLVQHAEKTRRIPDPPAFDWDLESTEGFQRCPSTRSGYWNILAAIDLILLAKGLMQRADSRSMTDFLSNVMKRKATNDRDYIYSLLFLLRAYMDVSVDYSKSVREVFEEAVIKLIQKTESLQIMEYASSRSCDLASWVPDFRLENLFKDRKLFKDGRLLSTGKLAASVAHGRFLPVRPRQGVLRLMGVRFDTVTKINLLSYLEWKQQRGRCLMRGVQFSEDEQDSSLLSIDGDPPWIRERRRLFDFAALSAARFTFTSSRGYYGRIHHRPCIGDHICVFATPSMLMMFCLRDAHSKIQLAYSLVGACMIWRNENLDTHISPVRAVEDVEAERRCAADKLFTPFLLV